MILELKVGMSDCMLNQYTKEQIEKIKRDSIIGHMTVEFSKLYDSGYFKIESNPVNNNKEDGMEYYILLTILNRDETNNLEKKLKNK